MMKGGSASSSLPPYSVRVSARARRVMLRITTEKGLVVTLPRGFDASNVPQIVSGKLDWIHRNLEKLSERLQDRAERKGCPLPAEINLKAIGEKWAVTYASGAGGRIRCREDGGYDLLTCEPAMFRPPSASYGRYETRPVFGYDDCLPTVEACLYPGKEWEIPDHGELCWLPWSVETGPGELVCQARSEALPLEFERRMAFGEKTLEWRFAARTDGDERIYFQHVMHALMPVERVVGLQLPGYKTAMDEHSGRDLKAITTQPALEWLPARPDGTAVMLMLQGIEEGEAAVQMADGPLVRIGWDHRLFPTLGIWWNNGGYPDEEGSRRHECALEPIPGNTSSLEQSYRDGTCLKAAAGQPLSWTVEWKMEG